MRPWNDPYRILVTGSRDWTDVHLIEQALQDEISRVWHAKEARTFVVVHGACPTGADKIASDWVRHKGYVIEERHPADWNHKGRSAGPIRNKKMVDLGADICFAFIGPCTSPRCLEPLTHYSHGATGCADLAEKAGIEVKRFWREVY